MTIEDAAPPVPAIAPMPMPVPAPTAGFWRRFLAFLVDGLLVGLGAGLTIAMPLHAPLSTMGGWERLIGFAIVVIYGGVLDSGLGGGRTPGKRLLGIRVVGVDGAPLPLPRALLRHAVLALPFFLNGLPLDPDFATGPVAMALSVAIFGGFFALFWLSVFNRASRRGVHDFAAGSWVVRNVDHPPGAPPPTWRGHLVIVGVFAALCAALPLVGERIVGGMAPLDDLRRLHAALEAEPGVTSATAMVGTNWGRGRTSTNVNVTLRLAAPGVDDEARARRAAVLVLQHYPDAANRDAVFVTLTHGFDMVIASGWSHKTYTFDPDDLSGAAP